MIYLLYLYAWKHKVVNMNVYNFYLSVNKMNFKDEGDSS
jgi:hypothetical protein